MAGSLGFGRQYCIPKGKASAEYRFVWLERLDTKTATEFRYLRWGLGIVIALVLGLVTKVILECDGKARPALAGDAEGGERNLVVFDARDV
jgi:hypothetical protein